MKQYTAIIIGAGGRATTYAKLMRKTPEKFKVVGVSDPIKTRRDNMQNLFDIPEENCFMTWEEILSRPKMADFAVIATMDNMHYEPAMRAIELGYHLLLEKPVAQTPEECIRIAQAAEEKGVSVLVCHVLRYTPFCKTVKKLVMDGKIGEIMSVIAVEAVGNVHQSHSYIRGDWHREDESTPMLLAKCCHDLDIIQWLIDKPCKKVSSFGELTYFTPEHAPKGAPERCVDSNCPVKATCPYSSEKIYLDPKRTGLRRTAARGLCKAFLPNDEEVMQGLRSTNFGACVFHAGNNVVDHQIVNMEFEGGATATLTMNAFNRGGRYIRLFGTKGELYAYYGDTEITVFSFETRQIEKFSVQKTEESIAGGHGGGDDGIIEELYDYLGGSYTGYCAADIDTSVKNHLIGFAAEKARRSDTVQNVAEYCAALGYTYK